MKNTTGIIGKLGVALGIIVPVEGKIDINAPRNTEDTKHQATPFDTRSVEIKSAIPVNAKEENALVKDSTATPKELETGHKEPRSIGKLLTDLGIIEPLKTKEIPTETTPAIPSTQRELGSFGKLCTKLGLIEPINNEEKQAFTSDEPIRSTASKTDEK